ncbi:MAG: HDOD domain-containing protein [Acidobacteriota bacterium]
MPTFSAQINELISLLSSDRASTDRLSKLILQNYTLSLDILRRANSVLYNRSRNRVSSVSRAIALMGVEVVRSLAMSMVFFEHFQKKSRGAGELMLYSLVTANISRNLALILRVRKNEEIYLCGMFRNLGEVLIACYLPQKYEKIQQEMKKRELSPYEAALKVIYFSYEDLGKAMASHWDLPKIVSWVMVPPDLRSAPKQGQPEDMVARIVQFSLESVGALFRGELAKAPRALDLLMKRSKNWLTLQPEEVQGLLLEAILDTQDAYSALDISPESLRRCQEVQESIRQHRNQNPKK